VKTLHSGPGKIYAIIVTCNNTTPAAIAIYDNTVAGSFVIATWTVSAYAPLVLFFPQNTPLVFETGLTIAAATGVNAYLLTEAEE
jgi:hypothetical protein